MPPQIPLSSSEARGLIKLAEKATVGVTDIVEGVHEAVWRTLGVEGPAPGRTAGITGFVYRSIRAVAQQVGAVSHDLLERLPAKDGGEPASRQRAALLAVLNGVLGDHLAASGNPLATPMTLRHQGDALSVDAPLALPQARGKLLLMLHGLCMNDLQWQVPRDGGSVDHGELVADRLGYTPLYLRYNSGRHVSQNGRDLAALLEQLVTAWPQPVEEISVLAHSMGGLIARSAIDLAQGSGARWPRHLRHVVFLGTPHHGSPLERAGNWVDAALGSTRYSAPFGALGRVRSAGITDLRHGFLRDADWQDRDRFRGGDHRAPLPLPAGVACHAIAATTATRRHALAERLTGDGLVPLRSALGEHDDPRHRLDFPPASRHVVFGAGHMALLHHTEVAQKLIEWMQPRPPTRPD
jgi:hypothetical protein